MSGNRKYQENVKTGWKQSLVPSLPSRYKTLVVAVKNYPGAVIKFFCSCLIFLEYFIPNIFSRIVYMNKFLFIQSNLYKTTTLETTQKWSYRAGGCLTKHRYKTVTMQMWWFLAGFQFFIPTVIFARIKICHCYCSELLFLLNVHMLRSDDGSFSVTLAANLKTLVS